MALAGPSAPGKNAWGTVIKDGHQSGEPRAGADVGSSSLAPLTEPADAVAMPINPPRSCAAEVNNRGRRGCWP